MAETKSSESVNIGLAAASREAVGKILNCTLSNQHVLYIKTRNFHWNLVGHRFHSLHEFFEKQYKALELAIDETAERIRKLGEVAPGSMAAMLEGATLKEHAGKLIHGDDAVKALVDDHEAVIRQMRKDIDACEDEHGDVGTADFLTGLIQDHEENAWMLRSLLE